MKMFFTSSINEYQLVSNHINYLYEQYNQINQFINSNFPVEYHNLLAVPEKVGDEVNWYTDKKGDFKLLETFDINVQKDLLKIYNARRYEIDNKCDRLSVSDDFDKELWSTILKNAFDPNNIFIFSNGTDLVLVWGIKTAKKADYQLPYSIFSNDIIPILDSDETISDSIEEEKEIELTHNPDETENNEEFEEIKEIEEDEVVAVLYEDVPEDVTDNSDVNTDEIINDEEPEYVSKINRKDQNTNKDKNLFYLFLDWIERFMSKFWWIILIILVIILWLILSKCTEKNMNNENENKIESRFEEITPDVPRKRTIPIDTSMFREDPNTGRIIVYGLLNIAMVENKERFKAMAVDLKNIFPEEKYKIVYFDDQTSRLQFNFPTSETNMKETIKTKLANYKLLIWEESVFSNSRAFNDPSFREEKMSWHLKAINMEKAWDISMGDTSVVVAIIDDGFDLSHKDFYGKNIKDKYNVVDDNSRVYGNTQILHGTHVAALSLAVANNGFGTTGIAPNCSFMPVQIGSGQPFFTMTDIVDGVLYALNHGADVINMSLGKYYGDALNGKSREELIQIINQAGKDEESFWNELFNLAEEKNSFIVIAAGNENTLIGLDPMQRSDNVLKVVAVDKNLKKANFSNYCYSCGSKNSYIAAPGVKIYSATPSNTFQYLDGTSMASPIVAGAVALIKTVNPTIRNQDIKKILMSTSVKTRDNLNLGFIQVDKALQKAKR